MNGYIINPSVFYWVSVVAGLKAVCIILTVLSGAGIGVISMVWFVEGFFDEEKKTAIKWLTRLIIVAIVGALMLIFIPSKQTMMEMLIAKYSTYENVGMTVDGIKSVADYIIESLKSLK